MAMNVFIDTNILMNTNDFHCNSYDFKFLFDNILNTFCSYYIPEICIDELVNKYENEISKKYFGIQKSIQTLHFDINFHQLSKLQIQKSVDKIYFEINKCVEKLKDQINLNLIQLEIKKTWKIIEIILKNYLLPTE